ncbi:unnamed protein product, partial [Effrenium voratum]
ALELAGQQKVDKNSRTYSLLVRSENDSAEIRRLLKEVGASGVDAVVSHAVLEACAKMRDVKLAESLSEMLNPNEASQAPAFMALIRFYTEASAPEKALALYDSLVKVEGDKERRRLPIDARTKHCLLAASRACNREDISVELQEVDPSRGVAMLSGTTDGSGIATVGLACEGVSGIRAR